jgi:hypothetical protein
MDAYVRREFMRALAPDLGWPAGWRAVLDAFPPATSRELLALLVRFRRQLLVCSEGGRARLRAWLDSPRHPTEPLKELRERIRDELLFYGDKELLPVAVEAFAHAPAPVRDVLLGEVAVLAVGASTNAWTASSRMVDREGRSPSRIIVICGRNRTGDELLRTFRHEVGHCWHAGLPHEHTICLTALGEAGLEDFAAEHGLSDQWVALRSRDERLADACAFVWGSRA